MAATVLKHEMFLMKNKNEEPVTTNQTNQQTKGNIGCLLLLLSPIILMVVSFLWVLLNNIFGEPDRSIHFKSKPIDPNDLMNPISKVYPTLFQIESTGFKRISYKSLSREGFLEIRDSNNYCYYISEYHNYIYPLGINPQNNHFFTDYNLIDRAEAPQIHYLKVGVTNSPHRFTSPKTIEKQRQWLKFRKETTLRGKKINNPQMDGGCSYAPRVNIIAIEYSIGGKMYKYQVDTKTQQVLNQKSKYVFK